MKKFMFLAVLAVLCFGINAQAAYVYPAWEGFNGATLPSPWLNGGILGMTGSAVQLGTNTTSASVTLALGGPNPDAFWTTSKLLDIQYNGTQASEVGVAQIQCLTGGTGIMWGLQMVKNDGTGAVNLQLQQLYLDGYSPALLKVVDLGDITTNPVTSLNVSAFYKKISPIKVELWMTYNVNNTGVVGGFFGQLDATAMSGTINPWYSANSYSGFEVDNWNLLPEPATIMLLGFGSLALIRRKRA